MRCDICTDTQFSSFQHAKLHYKSVHGVTGYLVCCNKKFVKAKTVDNHLQWHINPELNKWEKQLRLNFYLFWMIPPNSIISFSRWRLKGAKYAENVSSNGLLYTRMWLSTRQKVKSGSSAKSAAKHFSQIIMLNCIWKYTISRLRNRWHVHSAINGRPLCIIMKPFCHFFENSLISDTHQRNLLKITFYSSTKKSQRPVICANSVENGLSHEPALSITFKPCIGLKPDLAIKLYVLTNSNASIQQLIFEMVLFIFRIPAHVRIVIFVVLRL